MSIIIFSVIVFGLGWMVCDIHHSDKKIDAKMRRIQEAYDADARRRGEL